MANNQYKTEMASSIVNNKLDKLIKKKTLY